MEKDILEFFKQFEYEPEIKNADMLHPFSRAVVMGMGGSHLGADIVMNIVPLLPLSTWRDYGLPPLREESLKQTLFIASSYSGNTEEVLDAAVIAERNRFNLICIGKGGELIDFAKARKLPYIELPESSIQPRLALGFSSLALLKALGHEALLEEFKGLKKLDAEGERKGGIEIASALSGTVPVIYTSSAYSSLGYNWKIKFNETAKMPAFSNIFPELNHNEMQGFGKGKAGVDFSFVMIAGPDDDERIKNRMEITKSLMEKKGFNVLMIGLQGETKSERMFRSLVTADWVTAELARMSDVDPDKVPLIEAFKEELRSRN